MVSAGSTTVHSSPLPFRCSTTSACPCNRRTGESAAAPRAASFTTWRTPASRAASIVPPSIPACSSVASVSRKSRSSPSSAPASTPRVGELAGDALHAAGLELARGRPSASRRAPADRPR